MPYQSPTYAEYVQAIRAANEAVSQNTLLRQRISELEQRLQAMELTPDHVDVLGSAHLTRLASHYHTLLTAIVDELRARHHDVGEELVAPRVRALEKQLAAAKQRAWQAQGEARELEGEIRRLEAALAQAGATPATAEQAVR
jgi:hypothetical protein